MLRASACLLYATFALLCVPSTAGKAQTDPRTTPLTDRILAPWADAQRDDGTFPDWMYAGAAGGAGGYAESMLGYAMTGRDAARPDQQLHAAAQRALDWSASNGSLTRIGQRSVFEDLALTAAYDEHRDRMPASLRWKIKAHIRSVKPADTVPGRFGNKQLVDAVRVLHLRHSGLATAADMRRARQLLEHTMPKMAASQRFVFNGRPAVVFSDPPAHPLAYHALVFGLTARAVHLLGDAKAPVALRRLLAEQANGSLALHAPDGDVAYWGRSQEQSWALSMTAYGALAAARLDPTTAKPLRAMAARVTQRLADRHAGGQHGLWITPGAGDRDRLDDRRLGMDDYAAAASYSGLTAIALNWAAEIPAPASGAAKDPAGSQSTVLGTGPARFAVLRRGPVWMAVRGAEHGLDGRYGFGLVAAKVRTATGWDDLVRLRPHDYRAQRDADSGGPALITSDGQLAYPDGQKITSTKDSIRIDAQLRTRTGRYHGPVTVRMTAVGATVRMTWTARPGQRFIVHQAYNPARGTVCADARQAGGADGRMTGIFDHVSLTDGLASGSDGQLTDASAQLTATATGTLAVTLSADPATCR